jgi:hypothetical protein
MDLGARVTPVKFLIRDHAGQFTASFDAVFTAAGARILASPRRLYGERHLRTDYRYPAPRRLRPVADRQ